MKRCNNCGWFNLDTATRCEKCDEESLDVVVETPTDAKTEETVTPAPEVIPEEDTQATEQTPAHHHMMATVALGAVSPQSTKQESSTPAPKNKHLAATVMDAAGAFSAETAATQCPKCCYPIAGHMEYCPNCGATIRKSQSTCVKETIKEEHPKTEPYCQNGVKTLKETMRDIPTHLVEEEKTGDCYYLVPIDSIGDASIELYLDQVVNIGGHRYKFQK